MKFTVSLVVFDKHYNRIKLIAKENDNFYKYDTSYEVFVLFFTQETIRFLGTNFLDLPLHIAYLLIQQLVQNKNLFSSV